MRRPDGDGENTFSRTPSEIASDGRTWIALPPEGVTFGDIDV